jgi:hypothetical protein
MYYTILILIQPILGEDRITACPLEPSDILSQNKVLDRS